MEKLFELHSVVDNLRGYKNVPISFFVHKRPQQLFGKDGSLGVEYRDVITDYDPTCDDTVVYAELALEELFTEEEARPFIEWARTHRDDTTAKMEEAKLPLENNIMGIGAVPVGGGTDFLMISSVDDYDLPFEVWGFVDVRKCEFDETLPDARGAHRGFIFRNGQVEDWLLGDEPAVPPQPSNNSQCPF
jgi:hypothetical protein